MELLTAFVSACQNVKFSSVCIVLLGVILFQSVRQRITGGTQEDRIKGVMWFLAGLIELALKTLVSTPIPPIQ